MNSLPVKFNRLLGRFSRGPGAAMRRVKKAESMKITSLTGKAVITTELPRKSINRGTSNGSLKKTEQPETKENGTIDATTNFAETSRTASDNSRRPSENTNAKPEKKINNVSTDTLEDKLSKLHLRSASLPCNVRLPPKDKASSSGPSSPSNNKKATRNKSFAGVTKSSRAKAPVDIFSLPETDIDSGITVACDSHKSGRASKRNMHILDLLKDSEPEKPGNKQSPAKIGRSKSDGEKRPSQKRAARRPEIKVPGSARYAPNYPETGVDSEGGFSNVFIDAQRTFHVFVPDNKWPSNKRFTYMDGISDEKLLSDDSSFRRRQNSLPDLRSVRCEEEEEEDAPSGTSVNRRVSSKNRTASLNDLAKTSPASSAKQTPLHIDNLFSTTDSQGGSGSWSESPNFSPTPEQSASSNRLVQVTDL